MYANRRANNHEDGLIRASRRQDDRPSVEAILRLNRHRVGSLMTEFSERGRL